MSYQVGIDVGGTFTDLVAVDSASGSLSLLKVPSTPDEPDRGVIDAIMGSGLPAQEVSRLVHGSTVSTNALLERTGARVGLITTAGFEDVLEIGNTDRAHLYDLSWRKPAPLVPRRRRIGVVQRTDSLGNVLIELDEPSVRAAVERLLEFHVEVIAVCLLHAYANPNHERRTREIVREIDPTIEVSLSSDVMNAAREFDRSSTVVVDAYVKPVIAGYLHRLEQGLAGLGVPADLQVMLSSGGVTPGEVCAQLPVHTLLSGPAGGVVAARWIAEQSGYRNVITLDIGGTSADVALIIDGRPRMTTETEVEWGIPVHVPMIHIDTIGAGGGSIARIDAGGRLKVGPESAGARPGPACFGFGAVRATVTDANLVLGRLSPENYAGGTMPLHRELAERAISEQVAGPLGFNVLDAARGVLDIVNSNMRNLIRRITVQQGLDPRDFVLMAFGGGGPVHAVAIARDLGIQTVVVPQTPGVLSALGLLLAVPRHDFVQSFPRAIADLDWVELESVIAEMDRRGREMLRREHVVNAAVEVSLDMQFERQNYTVNVPLTADVRDPSSLRSEFDTVYGSKFGYVMDGQPVTIVNCRVSVSSADLRSEQAVDFSTVDERPARPARSRLVHFAAGDPDAECPVVDRRSLVPGSTLPSPCIVEQSDTTVVIPPGVEARIDDFANIVIVVSPPDEPANRPGGGR